MMRKGFYSLMAGAAALALAMPGAAMAQSAGSAAGVASPATVDAAPANASTPSTEAGSGAAAPVTPPSTFTNDVPPGGGGATVANTSATGPAADPSVVASLSAPGGTPPNAYMTGSVRVSDADMASFLSSPTKLLSLYAEGGITMSNYVRLLAASDNRAVPALLLLGASTEATPAQKTAIGAGLARAAIGAQIASPAYAAYIQQQVASSTDPALITAFTSALAEPATAAFGAGGAGAGGGAGAAGGGSLTGGGQGGTNGGLGNTPVRNTEIAGGFTRSAVVSSTDNGGGGNGVVFVPLFVTTPDGSPTN